jgi:hypothetical protein
MTQRIGMALCILYAIAIAVVVGMHPLVGKAQ